MPSGYYAINQLLIANFFFINFQEEMFNKSKDIGKITLKMYSNGRLKTVTDCNYTSKFFVRKITLANICYVIMFSTSLFICKYENLWPSVSHIYEVKYLLPQSCCHVTPPPLLIFNCGEIWIFYTWDFKNSLSTLAFSEFGQICLHWDVYSRNCCSFESQTNPSLIFGKEKIILSCG